MLRQAGIKTYFIVRVLKPVSISPQINNVKHNINNIAPSNYSSFLIYVCLNRSMFILYKMCILWYLRLSVQSIFNQFLSGVSYALKSKHFGLDADRCVSENLKHYLWNVGSYIALLMTNKLGLSHFVSIQVNSRKSLN